MHIYNICNDWAKSSNSPKGEQMFRKEKEYYLFHMYTRHDSLYLETSRTTFGEETFVISRDCLNQIFTCRSVKGTIRRLLRYEICFAEIAGDKHTIQHTNLHHSPKKELPKSSRKFLWKAYLNQNRLINLKKKNHLNSLHIFNKPDHNVSTVKQKRHMQGFRNILTWGSDYLESTLK